MCVWMNFHWMNDTNTAELSILYRCAKCWYSSRDYMHIIRIQPPNPGRDVERVVLLFFFVFFFFTYASFFTACILLLFFTLSSLRDITECSTHTQITMYITTFTLFFSQKRLVKSNIHERRRWWWWWWQAFQEYASTQL